MAITVSCGSCKKQFSVPDHYAGKTGKCTQCGAAILAPSAPSMASEEQLVTFGSDGKVKAAIGIGSALGAYKLQKKLGPETSTVFLAQGPKGPCAVKVLPQAMTQKSPTAAKRFLREARTLFGLEHPNVASVLDAGDELGTLFLAMELFSGRTARDLMAERGGKVPPAEALGIALQVAKGLEHLHAQKLLHRNLMPEHILIGPDGGAKIVGLGLVKSEESEQALTVKGMTMGTPQYMSPEQGRGETELDIRSDLWSLGITLYEMLGGAVPWNNKSALRVCSMAANDPLPPLREKNAQVSPTVVLVIEKLLAKKKEERYQSPTELIVDLQAIQDGTLVQGKPPSFTAAAPATAPGGTAAPATDAVVKKLFVVVGVLGALIVLLLVVVLVLALNK
jgi:serine/threonine-protein kinase